MTKRHNHYEAAFEELLRAERTPYVAVDEARRSLVAGGSLKSVDFLVSPPGGESFLVDIKGRQFPSGSQYWRNWSTRDDLRSLAEWARYFGPNFTPLLIFAYHVTESRSPVAKEELWTFAGRRYGFVAIRLADYWRAAHTLSTKWDTVSMSAAEFRNRAVSWRLWLKAGFEAEQDLPDFDSHRATEPVWQASPAELECT
jgi:hypothetical protein